MNIRVSTVPELTINPGERFVELVKMRVALEGNLSAFSFWKLVKRFSLVRKRDYALLNSSHTESALRD